MSPAARQPTMLDLLNRHVPIYPQNTREEQTVQRLVRAAIEERIFGAGAFGFVLGSCVKPDQVRPGETKVVVTDLMIATAKSQGESLFKQHFASHQNRFRKARKLETEKSAQKTGIQHRRGA